MYPGLTYRPRDSETVPTQNEVDTTRTERGWSFHHKMWPKDPSDPIVWVKSYHRNPVTKKET